VFRACHESYRRCRIPLRCGDGVTTYTGRHWPAQPTRTMRYSRSSPTRKVAQILLYLAPYQFLHIQYSRDDNMVALSHLVRAASTLTVVLYNAVPATEVKAYLTAHESNGTLSLDL